MKIKKILAALAAISMLPVSAFAANTATVESIEPVEKKVTITGTLDSAKAEEVFIIVTKDGADLSAATTEDVIKYQWEKESNADGSFEFEFVMNIGDAESGDYRYSIQAPSLSTPITGTFYFASETEKASVLDELNNTANLEASADRNNLVTNLDSYADAMGIGEVEAYKQANKGALADVIIANRTYADLSEAKEIILEAAIVESYNQSRTTAVASGTNLLNKDEIGLTSLPSGSTLYSIFENDIKDAGKQAIISGMMGKSVADYAGIQNEFMKNTILCAIFNAKTNGAGHITSLLTANNALAINDADLTAAITSYNANPDLKDAVNSALLAKGTIPTIALLASYINTAITDASSSTGGGGVAGGVGGGVSGPAAGGAVGNTGSGSGTGAGASIFTDVATDHWSYPDIFALYSLRVVSGYPDGSFVPNGLIKRQEGLKMICEAFDVYGTGIAIDFSDVPVGAWYEPYVKMGVENGIISGIGGNLFGTDKSITRQDLAVMIYRLAGSPEVTSTANAADSADIASYAVDAINYMVANGIMTGYPDGTIRPTKAITRAEAAKIINGCIEEGII